jgi:flagella basal body P-ring formation protein FlgA
MIPRLPLLTRRIGLIAYLLLIALLAIPTLARAEAPVTLRTDIAARGSAIALSDLFAGVEPAIDAAIAPAPAPGGTLTIDAAALQEFARRRGLIWANEAGVDRVVVRAEAAAAAAPAGPAAEPSIALPVLAAGVARNAVITDADLDYLETPVSRVPADALADPDLIVGMAARRALRPGVAIKSYDLERPAVIAKNEIVVVRFERGALALTARARALDDVAQGEQARFVNLQSNRVIEAVAAGPGEAWLVASAPIRVSTSFAGGQP